MFMTNDKKDRHCERSEAIFRNEIDSIENRLLRYARNDV